MNVLSLNKNQRDKLQKINPTVDKANCLTEAIGRGGSSSEFLTSVKKKTLILREANVCKQYQTIILITYQIRNGIRCLGMVGL